MYIHSEANILQDMPDGMPMSFAPITNLCGALLLFGVQPSDRTAQLAAAWALCLACLYYMIVGPVFVILYADSADEDLIAGSASRFKPRLERRACLVAKGADRLAGEPSSG